MADEGQRTGPGGGAPIELAPDEIVDVLYASALGREPDVDGRSYMLGVLAEQGGRAGLATLVSAIVDSDEFAGRVLPRFEERLRKPASDAVAPGFAHIVSLGTVPAAAVAVRSAGGRADGYPFDGLSLRPEAVIECLDDDFRAFLDRSHYAPAEGTTERRCRHAHFERKFPGTGAPTFGRRNPLLDADYADCIRSVDRFRALLASPDSKHFVLLDTIEVEGWTFRCERVAAALARRTTNAFLSYVLATAPDGTGYVSVQTLRRLPGARAVAFRPSARAGDLDFPRDLDRAILRSLAADPRPWAVVG